MAKHVSITADRRLTGGLAERTRTARRTREQAVDAAGLVGRNDLAPDLAIEQRPIAALRPAARRVRQLDPAHVAQVARSIAAFGFTVPLLIAGNGTLIDGHVRLEAARSLGLEHVACVVVDHLSGAEQQALKVAVNRLGETGAWDLDMLRLELAELDTLDIDLSLTGFSMPEIDIILLLDTAAEENQAGAEAELEPEAEAGSPVSRVGDLWRLGEHRLLCGDATDPDSYTRLMNGYSAAAVFTDPPYNVPIAGFVSSTGKHKEFAMGVGEMTDDQFEAFLADVLGRTRHVLETGGVLFACMDWRGIDKLMQAGKMVGLAHVNTAVWNKGAGGMGSLYRSAHELVAVFANGARPRTNNVALGRHGRDRTNVWSYDGANRRGSSANDWLEHHPTPKPVELVRDALLDVTNRGDIVLDPFMGSGTTIMAAHACGRIGYGLELDPGYVDVIVRRWIASGGTAELHSSGESMDVVAKRRVEERTRTSVEG